MVVGSATGEEVLPALGGQTLRDQRIVEGVGESTLIGQRDGTVAAESRLEHPVGPVGDRVQRGGVQRPAPRRGAPCPPTRWPASCRGRHVPSRAGSLRPPRRVRVRRPVAHWPRAPRRAAAHLCSEQTIVDRPREIDRFAHVPLGIGEVAQLALRSAHRPEPHDPGPVGHVVAFDDAARPPTPRRRPLASGERPVRHRQRFVERSSVTCDNIARIWCGLKCS